jgi:hypothetical protein
MDQEMHIKDMVQGCGVCGGAGKIPDRNQPAVSHGGAKPQMGGLTRPCKDCNGRGWKPTAKGQALDAFLRGEGRPFLEYACRR